MASSPSTTSCYLPLDDSDYEPDTERIEEISSTVFTKSDIFDKTGLVDILNDTYSYLNELITEFSKTAITKPKFMAWSQLLGQASGFLDKFNLNFAFFSRHANHLLCLFLNCDRLWVRDQVAFAIVAIVDKMEKDDVEEVAGKMSKFFLYKLTEVFGEQNDLIVKVPMCLLLSLLFENKNIFEEIDLEHLPLKIAVKDSRQVKKMIEDNSREHSVLCEKLFLDNTPFNVILEDHVSPIILNVNLTEKSFSWFVKYEGAACTCIWFYTEHVVTVTIRPHGLVKDNSYVIIDVNQLLFCNNEALQRKINHVRSVKLILDSNSLRILVEHLRNWCCDKIRISGKVSCLGLQNKISTRNTFCKTANSSMALSSLNFSISSKTLSEATNFIDLTIDESEEEQPSPKHSKTVTHDMKILDQNIEKRTIELSPYKENIKDTSLEIFETARSTLSTEAEQVNFDLMISILNDKISANKSPVPEVLKDNSTELVLKSLKLSEKAQNLDEQVHNSLKVSHAKETSQILKEPVHNLFKMSQPERENGQVSKELVHNSLEVSSIAQILEEQIDNSLKENLIEEIENFNSTGKVSTVDSSKKLCVKLRKNSILEGKINKLNYANYVQAHKGCCTYYNDLPKEHIKRIMKVKKGNEIKKPRKCKEKVKYALSQEIQSQEAFNAEKSSFEVLSSELLGPLVVKFTKGRTKETSQELFLNSLKLKKSKKSVSLKDRPMPKSKKALILKKLEDKKKNIVKNKYKPRPKSKQIKANNLRRNKENQMPILQQEKDNNNSLQENIIEEPILETERITTNAILKENLSANLQSAAKSDHTINFKRNNRKSKETTKLEAENKENEMPVLQQENKENEMPILQQENIMEIKEPILERVPSLSLANVSLFSNEISQEQPLENSQKPAKAQSMDYETSQRSVLQMAKSHENAFDQAFSQSVPQNKIVILSHKTTSATPKKKRKLYNPEDPIPERIFKAPKTPKKETTKKMGLLPWQNLTEPPKKNKSFMERIYEFRQKSTGNKSCKKIIAQPVRVEDLTLAEPQNFNLPPEMENIDQSLNLPSEVENVDQVLSLPSTREEIGTQRNLSERLTEKNICRCICLLLPLLSTDSSFKIVQKALKEVMKS